VSDGWDGDTGAMRVLGGFIGNYDDATDWVNLTIRRSNLDPSPILDHPQSRAAKKLESGRLYSR
jgi:hypothetical protein